MKPRYAAYKKQILNTLLYPMNYIIERSNRRSITLSLKPDGTITVKAPHLVPKIILDQFVSKHKDWIDKRKEKIAKAPQRKTGNYSEGDTFFYLGKEISLTYGNFTNISVKEDSLRVPIGLKFRVKKELESWYILQGKNVITKQVEKFASEMNTTYTSLLFSDTKSKWGSCSHDNKLQFSWRLIMAPVLVMNYVIIHELAHTTEKNHSRNFWKIVETYNPSYRQSRKWLNENGHTLTF